MTNLHDAPALGEVGPEPEAVLVGQALRMIDGERKVRVYLAWSQVQQADSYELALIRGHARGRDAAGFCRLIAAAQRRHHA
jgi:hypothetical protein